MTLDIQEPDHYIEGVSLSEMQLATIRIVLCFLFMTATETFIDIPFYLYFPIGAIVGFHAKE